VYSFTDIVTEVVAIITAGLGLVDPSTFIGGVIAAFIGMGLVFAGVRGVMALRRS